MFEAVLDDGCVTLDERLPHKVSSIISKMLNKDPNERPSAKELLAYFAELDSDRWTAGGARKGFYVPTLMG